MFTVQLFLTADEETTGEGDALPKHKQKSVISQVHECALQMKLNVEFEVVKEVGPPHDRSYVVRCSLKNPKNEHQMPSKASATDCEELQLCGGGA
ncbi:hypothetical protein TELCIR_18940 [Teladorsagia circumcincta]|uniref:DRBM domain-containing protein n=1 Tax=Teladorsagia circumcincta TaxID=45464 RepID=A0A2G9TNT2_TELCI|nr:hypothetical protein TELCIR_18940 [Teladorsagia circumcincta]